MPANTTDNLDCIVINPKTKAQKCIIWLHGLGADGHDFAPIVPELRLPESLNVRFVFPHAPIMPVTINAGYEMRAWFDIHGISAQAKIDEAGIKKSEELLRSYIATQEADGISSDNIILAGFSQGAVVALITGLCFEKPLAGIMALSGFLPLAEKILQHASPINSRIPIFMAHGTEDTIVPYAFGKASYVALSTAGYSINWHSYPMPHSVCAEEIADIREWIIKAYQLKNQVV